MWAHVGPGDVDTSEMTVLVAPATSPQITYCWLDVVILRLLNIIFWLSGKGSRYAEFSDGRYRCQSRARNDAVEECLKGSNLDVQWRT